MIGSLSRGKLRHAPQMKNPEYVQRTLYVQNNKWEENTHTHSVPFICTWLNTFVVCPQNKLYSWGAFRPLKFLRRILFHMLVNLVGNHLNSCSIYIYNIYITGRPR